MSEYPLQRFIDLINFDQSIVSLEKEITVLDTQISQVEREITTYQEDLERCKEHSLSLRKEVDTQERTMKELDQQERAKRARLDSATNQKEYKSLQQELEGLKKAQHDLEDTLLGAWKALETYTLTLNDKKKFCEEKINANNTVVAQLMQKKHELQEKIQELLRVRASKEENIPQEWLTHYTTMRMQVANPVVPVKAGQCSACFYSISQRDLAELRRGLLVRCRDCFRFLYTPRPAQPVEDKSA